MFEEDRQLARRLVEGDQRAFATFFERYAQRLAAFVLRRTNMDRSAAEDIVQNVMIRSLRAMPGYRGEASLLTWLCQICRSELADSRRLVSRRPATISMDSEPAVALAVGRMQAAAHHEPESAAQAGEPSARMLALLERLPERQAQLLEWKYGDDLLVDDIARQLGTSVTAAQSLLARARDALRRLWLEEQQGAQT